MRSSRRSTRRVRLRVDVPRDGTVGEVGVHADGRRDEPDRAADLACEWELLGDGRIVGAAGVAEDAKGVVWQGGGTGGAFRQGAVDDEFVKGLDDAVAGDLNGAVSAWVVSQADEVLAEVGALRGFAEP